MEKYQVSQLTYDDAIKQLGSSFSGFEIGQLVLFEQASGSYKPESQGSVTYSSSVIVAEVVEVNNEGSNATLSKLRIIDSSDGNFPDSGSITADLKNFSKTIEERISESDEFFNRI